MCSSDLPAYTAGLFMPNGQTPILFSSTHSFTDIKLGNIATSGVAGAISGFSEGAIGRGTASNILNKGASLAGHPINPGVEVLYSTTNRRSWIFSFQMAPASEKESNDMKAIIKNLRKWSSPEIENLGLTFKAPAEFAIKFYHKNRENENIPKIRRSVLSRVDADYNPSGEWSTFSNGHPVACLLTLEFQELEIIHRKWVEEGY